MSSASSAAVATGGGPSLRTKVAAIAVVAALAVLAAYAMFSGPTPAPAPAGGTRAAPTQVAPPGEEGYPEREGGR